MGYSYYDTPDGHDCFKKMWYLTKIAGIAGLTVSAVDVRIHSHTQGFYPTAARFVHFTFPFIGMAAAFTAGTCMATNLRHKDDRLNYFLGGCAAGAVFGAWRKSGVAGVVASVFFGVAGIVKKTSLRDGWELVPEPVLRSYGGALGSRHDFTFTKPPPKLWKTKED